MFEMELIGGPFDGAEGPCGAAGEFVVWVYVDPLGRGLNGLCVALGPRAGSARYDFEALDPDGTYVYVSSDWVRDERSVVERRAVLS